MFRSLLPTLSFGLKDDDDSLGHKTVLTDEFFVGPHQFVFTKFTIRLPLRTKCSLIVVRLKIAPSTKHFCFSLSPARRIASLYCSSQTSEFSISVVSSHMRIAVHDLARLRRRSFSAKHTVSTCCIIPRCVECDLRELHLLEFEFDLHALTLCTYSVVRALHSLKNVKIQLPRDFFASLSEHALEDHIGPPSATAFGRTFFPWVQPPPEQPNPGASCTVMAMRVGWTLRIDASQQ